MLGVVQRNPGFRRIWLSQVVSQGGDWFSRVAVLALILDLSPADPGGPGGISTGAGIGLGVLFGGELAARLLPSALMGPLAGPVADRLPRRLLMILSDLVRCALVLTLLLIDEPGELTLLFAIVVAQMSAGIFFESARSAAVPTVVPREELHEAYALSAITWSTMLSVGALAGGLMVDSVGIAGVLVLDALTYLASAAFLFGLKLERPPVHPTPFHWRDVVFLTDLRLALEHVRSLGLTLIIFAKSFWGAAGGFLVLLSLAATERFGTASEDAVASTEALSASTRMGTALGILLCARGIGTGLGPLLARRFHGSSDTNLRAQIRMGFFVGALGYLAFSFCDSLTAAALAVVLAHMGGSTLWVSSTVLWQKHIENRFRGRVYALEFLSLTVTFAMAAVLAGWLFDATHSLSNALWIMSGLGAALGGIWILCERRAAGNRAEVSSPTLRGPR